MNIDDFIRAYEAAANSRRFDQVRPLICKDASFWFTNGHFDGIDQIKKAFEDTWKNILEEKYTISNMTWPYRSDALCVMTYSFESDGMHNGERKVYRGFGTNVICKEDNAWRMKHEHLSIAI